MKYFFSFLFLLLLIQPVAAQDSDEAEKDTRLIFVRHAEKVNDGSRNPHLSNKGKERASQLAVLLYENYDITSIYSTDYYRTQETVVPLSEKLGIGINNYGLQNPDSLVQEIINLHRGKDVLIMGHSNTTPNLVNIALGEEKFKQIDESDYSNIFVVWFRKAEAPTVEHITY